MWRSEDILRELFLSFHRVGSEMDTDLWVWQERPLPAEPLTGALHGLSQTLYFHVSALPLPLNIFPAHPGDI